MRTREITDVYSPDVGVVKYALKTTSSYGRRLYIEYPDYIMMFAHLEEFYVKEGDTVDGGQLIGKIGETGYSQGKHLHVSLFNKRAEKLTAAYTSDPTFTLKLAPFAITNTKCTNGYGSKFCNPKLKKHEGLDFGLTGIPGWEEKRVDPLYQDYRLEKDYPEEYA